MGEDKVAMLVVAVEEEQELVQSLRTTTRLTEEQWADRGMEELQRAQEAEAEAVVAVAAAAAAAEQEEEQEEEEVNEENGKLRSKQRTQRKHQALPVKPCLPAS